MNNHHVLIFASNYTSNWTLYQSVNDAHKFYELMDRYYRVRDIRTYLGPTYIRRNVMPAMDGLADKLRIPNQVGLIYCAGHGDRVRDHSGDEADGMDECWKTHTRETILDDEIRTIFNRIHPTSKIVIISDTCSSGTIHDLQFDPHVQAVAISSCQDPQDSLQTGDGSVMSFCLFQILKQNKTISIRDLKTQLEQKIITYIGTLQSCNVNVSQEQLWVQGLFEN